MTRAEAVLRTKLNPPRLSRHTLLRPRLNVLFRDALDARVTIVQASAGYGKSTALAALNDARTPLFWYSASEGDTDAHQFLAHLIAAFHLGLPALSDTPLALLHDADPHAPRRATDALLNALADALTAPALLVIDDYHLAASDDVDALLDHFLAFLPPHLHVIVSTRYAPRWEHLPTWRAHGQVLDIKRDALAFTRDEIAALFAETYKCPLTPRDVDLVYERTEGWPIALQLVWQELRAKPKAKIADLLASESAETLFAYLARDVLAQQPRDVQHFLLSTAVLRELETRACQAVAPNTDCSAMLAYLRERDLFITSLGGEHYRYHHLFHDFLREYAARLDADAVRARHRRAAEFYREAGNASEAIFHFLRAHAFDDAVAQIASVGEEMLRVGRLDTLASWLDALPPEAVAAQPVLMFFYGDLARLQSRFDDALAWYAHAERAWRAAQDKRGIVRALRGQALVYLDTLRAPQAEQLLQEALRLMDGLDDRVAHARLLELLAENKLNTGKAEEAERLRAQARTLREEGPSEDVLSVRVKLRTGRLDEAREILEAWAREERGKPHAPRAHRETLLVLSLIHSLQGNADAAFDTAQEAITLGAQLASPFVSAVGQMRLGHALQLRGDWRAALRCYEDAIALGDQLAVQRTRAEARWGMTRAHGYSGDVTAARRDAAEGIEIAQSTGDAWLVAILQIALGASLVLAQRAREAIQALTDAHAAMRACGDTFGQTAARMWLALAHAHQRERALAHLDDALALAQTHRYDYLFTTRTFLGMSDARMIVPLLLEARRRGRHASYAARLLAAMGLANIAAHPGYQLRVQTFGVFRVWRGENEIGAREWQRKKARQLLQLFIARRGRLIEREEIFELLYRDVSPDAAARDFKVALNALNHALEPARGDADPAFIAREGSAYGLRADADVWIDADEFTRLIARGDAASDETMLEAYRRALALYHDDFLIADARYDDWAITERERLLALYLRAADRLATELLARGAHDECIAWCEKILARDRCWEHAYRLMMQAYAARGERAQVRRVFEQCKRVLREELEVEPSAVTVEVYQAGIR
ncbi:MAG: transcriptional regulator, partial [Anaerolineae bacterium]|nr:transcriptional regulator [Anaerolineae bacterium]